MLNGVVKIKEDTQIDSLIFYLTLILELIWTVATYIHNIY